jgi:rod shape-determining protein MreD
MILVASTPVRVGLLVLLAVVLQISGLAHLRVFGINADLIPLLVGAAALYAGAIPGAMIGFFTGLALDLALGQQLGVSSLVLTVVGWFVGLYHDRRDTSHGLLPIPVAVAATIGYAAGTAAVNYMLDLEAAVSLLVLQAIALTALFNLLIALPVFAVVRRFLRPVLITDPFAPRRTRGPTLSPSLVSVRR